MRIVSLLPSATEIVYALGLGDQLEGRTFEYDYPPEPQQKPIVSSTGLPENLPLGEIDDAVRAATAGETPLYRLDEARIAQIQPRPDPHPGPVSGLRRAVRRRRRGTRPARLSG